MKVTIVARGRALGYAAYSPKDYKLRTPDQVGRKKAFASSLIFDLFSYGFVISSFTMRCAWRWEVVLRSSWCLDRLRLERQMTYKEYGGKEKRSEEFWKRRGEEKKEKRREEKRRREEIVL
jgi:hypothetical protein